MEGNDNKVATLSFHGFIKRTNGYYKDKETDKWTMIRDFTWTDGIFLAYNEQPELCNNPTLFYTLKFPLICFRM